MYTKIDEGCHLGLCGCSYATDFDSYNYGTYDESTMTNDDLWCNRFTGQASLDNFSRGGSSNYDIYMQIKKALEYNCNYILVFWTNTNRFNAFWKDGHPSIVPKSKDEQDYRKKYFSPYFQKFFSYLLVMDAARLLDLHIAFFPSVKYKFFIHAGHNFPSEVSEYPNVINFHPAQLDYPVHSSTSPNHLNEKGQDLVNEELNLYL
tara:strand:- start:1279 stop:1893 length:615 start_codon:yes stop_codon:yes gene_type:complete